MACAASAPSQKEIQALKELMAYPKNIAVHILAGPHRERFLINLRGKLLLKTMYSGMGSEGLALLWLLQAIREVEPSLIPDDVLRWFACCDKRPLPKKVLSWFGKLGPEHIFDDILDRHCPKIRQQLDNISWSQAAEADGPQAKRARRHDLPPTQAHGEESDCFIVDPPITIGDVGDDSEGENIEGNASSMSQTLDAIFETSRVLALPDAYGVDDTAPCILYDCNCPVNPPQEHESEETPRRLSILTGGMTCIDFSAIGKRQGYAGASTKPALSLQASFRGDDIDLGVLECAPEWKTDLFRDSCVADTHDLHPCDPRPCPSQFGWPFTRKRFWGLILKKNRRLVQSWPDFSKHFLQDPTLDGHVFFCDTREHVHGELSAAAMRNGSSVLPGEQMNFQDHALTTYQGNHLRFALAAHPEWIEKTRAAGKEIPRGAHDILCDLDHNPDKCTRMSTTGMAVGLLTHGCIWSGRFERYLTKREVMSLQGFPTVPDAHGSNFVLPWAHMLDELSLVAFTSLAGNGMHMHILSLVLAWGLACTERQ